MVLEVPNKSSNILNTFGLSKSHRSGIAEPAAAPACRVLFAALALAISHARARTHAAQELRLLQPLLYTTVGCSPTLESKEAKKAGGCRG